ncbi:hypothetical protein JTB14_016325 [Gonioctena quinquepunctata]|nr:hypothetical protein JTB14_016325 [Gonioctena quinquepunctata]
MSINRLLSYNQCLKRRSSLNNDMTLIIRFYGKIQTFKCEILDLKKIRAKTSGCKEERVDTPGSEHVGLNLPPDDCFDSVSNKSETLPSDIVNINEYFFNETEGRSMCRGQVNSEYSKSLNYFCKLALDTDGNILESMCEYEQEKG